MEKQADAWLERHGLSQYKEAFHANDVDAQTLSLLTEDDLRELGMSLGHRKAFMAARAAEAETSSVAPIPPAAPAGTVEGARRLLSVLFADVAGSTRLADQLDPEDYRDLMRAYQDAAAGAATRYGGHVAKYLGDGVLVCFGWPAAFEDHAERAVRAGLELLSAVSDLRGPRGEAVAARVGVATGDVIVGDIVGTHAREDGALSGATLNLAARLQEQAENGDLVISAETRALVGGNFELAPLSRLTLKGFKEDKDAFRVVGRATVESRFEASPRARRPLVGRKSELNLLLERWGAVVEGRGQVVLVSGEAGIGKSRLAEALLERLEEEPHQHLRLQCSPFGVASAFHPIIERLTRVAGLSEHDDEAAAYAKLEQMAAGRGLDVDEIAPVYAALMGVQAPAGRDLSFMEPAELRSLIVSTLVEGVAAGAERQPTLLFVEDAHWIDPSTCATLDRLVRACRDLRVMLLVTHRPEWSVDWADTQPHVSPMRVMPLEPDQMAELAAEVLGRPPDTALVEDLTARTDGVPLFVEEVARMLAERDERDAIPATLQGMLMARLERGSDVARRVALNAAVLGREFDAQLLAELGGIDEPTVHAALEELERVGVVRESGFSPGLFVFRHALIQDAAYQSLLRGRRRDLHAAAARALTRVRPGLAEREPEVLARHHAEAEEFEQAAALWTLAAERELSRSENFEAVSHAEAAYNAAVGVVRKGADPRIEIDAKLLLARAYYQTGRLQQSLGTSLEAAAAAKSLDDPTRFARAAAQFVESSMMAGQQHERAIELCEQARRDDRLTDGSLRTMLLGQLVHAYMITGAFDEGAIVAREASAHAERIGDARALFRLRMSRFFAPIIAREPEEIRNWRRFRDELLKLSEATDEIDMGRARTIALHVSAEMGARDDLDAAIDSLAEVGKVRQHMQLHWVERHARAMQAILDGDLSSAENFAKEALRLGRVTHGEHVEGLYGVQMFTIRREQARLHEVAPVVKQLIDQEDGDVSWKPGFAVIAADLGFLDAARRIMEELAEADFSLPLDAKYSTTLGYMSDVAVSLRDPRMAEVLYGRLEPYRNVTITLGTATACYGAAGRRLGALAGVIGDLEAAEEHFETALEIDAAMRAPIWLARSQAAFARMLVERGRGDDASRAVDLRGKAAAAAARHGFAALDADLASHA